MSSKDTNATLEQRAPVDVIDRAEQDWNSDRKSLAPAAVQPQQARDESERPVVNPVTGGAI